MTNILSVLGVLSTGSIVLICAIGAIFVATFATSSIRYLKHKKKRAEEEAREVGDVEIKKGVRYTEDMTVVDNAGDMNISFGKGDLLLKQNVTYTASKKTEFKPGKYTILSTKEGEDAFNVRIGAYVKEYKHNQEVVIAEGEEVTPVSTDIILR